jgi:hypothetical protein
MNLHSLQIWRAMVLSFFVYASGSVAATRYVSQDNPSATPPFTTWETAARTIQDAVDAALPGDEIIVSAGLYNSGGRVVHGTITNRVAIDKPVHVKSLSGASLTTIAGWTPYPAWFSDASVRCVYLANGAALTGFTLSGGSTRIAGDKDQEQSGGALWCESATAVVSNCVLTGNAARQRGGAVRGGRLENCVVTNNWSSYYAGGGYAGEFFNSIIISNTAFSEEDSSGGGVGQCVLNNCRLTGNRAEYGGGAADSMLTNCIVEFNEADRGDHEAGGAGNCQLDHCFVIGNSSSCGGGAETCDLNYCFLSGNSAYEGGGAFGCRLRNCTVIGNDADYQGGGVYACNAVNSIIYWNYAGAGIGYYNFAADSYYQGSSRHCCTTPMPTNGNGMTGCYGNITDDPLFVEELDEDEDNYTLQANSPCINAGLNREAIGATDLTNNASIVGGTVDLGAFEWQGTGSLISYAWLQQYGFPIDGSQDLADPDADGFNNWQEWRAGTDPANSSSFLRLVAAQPVGLNVLFQWEAVLGKYYILERSTNLAATPRFYPLTTNLTGQTGLATFTDTNALPLAPVFYRIGVSD